MTVYAAELSALASQSGTTIQVMGFGGPNPLAPTIRVAAVPPNSVHVVRPSSERRRYPSRAPLTRSLR